MRFGVDKLRHCECDEIKLAPYFPPLQLLGHHKARYLPAAMAVEGG